MKKSKTKTETKTTETPEFQSKRESIKKIVTEIGANATYESVASKVAEQNIPITESTLRQYVYAVRVELGFVKTRNKANNDSREGSIADLMNAKKLVESLGTDPHSLLELISHLESFGNLPTLKKCLNTLEELTLSTPSASSYKGAKPGSF